MTGEKSVIRVVITLKGLLLTLSLLCWHSASLVQARQSKKPPRGRVVPLHRVGEYPNRYVPGTFKISNVILEDVRDLEGNIYAVQLYDPKTKVRRGAPGKGAAFDTYDFLTCAGADVGTSLIQRKEKWLNRRVNVYLIMQDVGLTVFIYAGYIEKIELLDEKGKVVETIPLAVLVGPNRDMKELDRITTSATESRKRITERYARAAKQIVTN